MKALRAVETTVNPFGGDISDEALASWLSQFDAADRWAIAALLEHFHYYPVERVFQLLRELHRQLLAGPLETLNDTLFIPYGYVAETGSAVGYLYRQANNLRQTPFLSLSDLRAVSLSSVRAVVFLDDFVGSGHDAERLWRDAIEPLLPRSAHCQYVFAALVGYESGIEYLASHTGLSMVVAEVIPASQRPFQAGSTIFPDADRRAQARQVVQAQGERLAPTMPLGYAGTEALVSFFFGTPNNTLPIFWSDATGWQPLLSHGESLRGSQLQLDPPHPLAREPINPDPKRPHVELSELHTYNIPSEIANRIFSEFGQASVFLVLAPVVHDLSLAESVFSHLMSLMHKLEYAMHEKEPVRAGLLIPGTSLEEAGLGLPFITARDGLTVANEDEILSLAEITDGYEGAVVIQRDGHLVGNVVFPRAADSPDDFLPRRYWDAAAASAQCHGLLFLFAGEGRMVVFYDGERVLSHRNATWHVHSTELEWTIRSLEIDHGLPYRSVEALFKVAFEMADMGYGALFTLGDHESVLRISSITEDSFAHWDAGGVMNDDYRPIIALARQDGATILASDGQAHRGMVFLRPPADARAVEQIGTGSRHDTAARVSAVTRALTVAVSVDGGVSAYTGGQLLFRIMG